eukprot:6745485-Alexandrium_andersonii.AAC.1
MHGHVTRTCIGAMTSVVAPRPWHHQSCDPDATRAVANVERCPHMMVAVMAMARVMAMAMVMVMVIVTVVMVM